MAKRIILAALLAVGGPVQAAPPGTVPTPDAVMAIGHDPLTGDLLGTKVSGAVVDAGLANQRGNNSIWPLASSGTSQIGCGYNVGFISATATVPAVTAMLPNCPRAYDIVRVVSNQTITSLTVEDASANVLISGLMLVANQAISFAYYNGAWMPFTMPPPMITAASIDAALGFAPYSAANPAGYQTSAQVQAAITALNLAGQFYPLSSNPAAYLTVCPTATATIAGCSTMPIGTPHKVTASATLGAVNVLVAGLLPSVPVTVPGVLVGDVVGVSFATAPPTGLTLSAAEVTAANTVLVTPASTAGLVLSSGNYSLNFVWWH